MTNRERKYFERLGRDLARKHKPKTESLFFPFSPPGRFYDKDRACVDYWERQDDEARAAREYEQERHRRGRFV